MTAPQPLLLPGDQVLIDSRCCSKCDVTFFTRGDRGRVETVARGGELLVRIERTDRSTWFSHADLIAAPHDGDPIYPCCRHCACDDRSGHAQPCVGCQLERDSADRRAAREMNQAGSASVAVVLAVCIFGSLLFLALLAGGQRLMCATHDDGLRYCPGYQAAPR
jgi:hypothetical protein